MGGGLTKSAFNMCVRGFRRFFILKHTILQLKDEIFILKRKKKKKHKNWGAS